MMKPYPDSVLNYEKGFSIIINELKTPVEIPSAIILITMRVLTP